MLTCREKKGKLEGGGGGTYNYIKELEERALTWGERTTDQSKGQWGIGYFLSFAYQYTTNTSSTDDELTN